MPDELSRHPGANAATRKHPGEYIRAEDIARVNAYAAEHHLGPALLGLYVTMTAKPPAWRYSAERLGREFGYARNAVQRMLQHLEVLGYLRREKVQSTGGLFRTSVVFDPHGLTDSEHE